MPFLHSIREEYGVVYTVFPEPSRRRNMSTEYIDESIFWIGFLPIGWISRWVDPRPAKAVEATYFQFLLDANRDGLLK